MCPCQGPGGAHGLFLCPPQAAGHPPGPSYLEMPAKAQMFSVRLPSLSTRHEGPPGPRGHASHAAGTVETTDDPSTMEGSERGQPPAQPASPPQAPSPHACLFTKPPPPAREAHIQPLKIHLHTQAHPMHTHRPVKAHGTCASPRHTALDAHPHTGICWETQAQPCRKGRQATLSDSHRCRQTLTQACMGQGIRVLTGLPRRQLQLALIGAAAVGPGAQHFAANGLLAHQRRGAVGVPQAGVAGTPTPFQLCQLLLGHQEGPTGQADSGSAGSGQAVPPPLKSSTPHRTPKPSPSSLVHCPLPGWGAAYPTAHGPLCWQPPEGDQCMNIL